MPTKFEKLLDLENNEEFMKIWTKGPNMLTLGATLGFALGVSYLTEFDPLHVYSAPHHIRMEATYTREQPQEFEEYVVLDNAVLQRKKDMQITCPTGKETCENDTTWDRFSKGQSKVRKYQFFVDDLYNFHGKELREQGIHKQHIYGLIHVESTGNPLAQSHKLAFGPAQTKIDAAKEMGCSEQEYLHPASNIECGALYLLKQSKRFNGIDNALKAYNWGPGNLTNSLESQSTVPEEVEEYRTKVLLASTLYEDLNGTPQLPYHNVYKYEDFKVHEIDLEHGQTLSMKSRKYKLDLENLINHTMAIKELEPTNLPPGKYYTVTRS